MRRWRCWDWAIGFVTIGPVDVAMRKIPGDHKAHRATLARANRDARAERTVFRLLTHVPASAWFVVVAFRQPARPGKLLPINGEIIEPLAAKMVTRAVDINSVRCNCQVATLGQGQVLV